MSVTNQVEAGDTDETRAKILVVGSVNVDLVTRVRAFPRPGETLLGSEYETHHGGKGANQAVAAARLGGRVSMIGRVGDDGFGSRLRTELAAEGVNVAALEVVPGPSGAAFVTLDEGGQNTIIVAPGANARLRPEDLAPELFRDAGVVVLQLEVPPATVRRAIGLAREAGATVVVNAAPASALAAASDLRGSDVLIVNEGEAHTLVPDAGDARTALRSLAKHVPHVIITLGAEGLLWQRSEEQGFMPAIPVQPVDTTAAGDAFVGAVAAALAQGCAWEATLRQGRAAGALAVTRPGAQRSLPGTRDVRQLLEADSLPKSS